MNREEAKAAARATGEPQQVLEPNKEAGSTRVAISLKIEFEVLERIKAQAVELGLPYQTYINSVLTQRSNEPTYEATVRTLKADIARIIQLIDEKSATGGKAV